MAVLSARGHRRTYLLAAFGLALLGCALGERLGFGGGDRGLAFSHALHYGEEGLDCIACHPTYDSEEEAGMPALGQCMLCHEDIDAEKPEDRRIATLFDGEVFRAQKVSALSDEIVFSHPDHALDEELCGSCHEGIEESERLDERIAVTMDECSTCHASLGVANECGTCHAELGVDRAPWTHDNGWDRLHGDVFRAGSPLTANRCDLCHSERDCNSCHFDVMPASHQVNFWRLRGHGIQARMDRQSCAVCHRTDSCEACHREARPQNHAAMWGNPVNRHCFSCHISGPDTGCFACHTGTPSHSLGTPQPADHSPGMNCRQCHGITAPLPHVDNGAECAACHPG